MKTPTFLAPLLRRQACSCALVNERGAVIASNVRGAFDSASRKKGLLGRDRFPDGEAIIIAPCNAVHMFFMRFAIDVVHVDREGHVVKVTSNLRPWRVDASLRGFAVVELPAGTAARLGLAKGDRLTVAETADGLSTRR